MCVGVTIGARGEKAAASFAEHHGGRVVARNWRGGGGELDLVLEDGAVLAFAEVKTRPNGSRGDALEAVTSRKIVRMTKAALAFLSASGQTDKPCRFDVLAVAQEHGRLVVSWVKDAFSAAVVT
jgi:putative endonuclease